MKHPMKKFEKNHPWLYSFLLIGFSIAVFWIIMDDANESGLHCLKEGCNNEMYKYGYCYEHQPSNSSSSSNTKSTSNASKSNHDSAGSLEGVTNSTNQNKKTGSSSSNVEDSSAKTNFSGESAYDDDEDSYDAGYDAVYFDLDYDEERYENDDDYANGVDDAMEDIEEYW